MLENIVNYTKSHQERTRELVTTKYARLSSSGDQKAAGLWPQGNVCKYHFLTIFFLLLMNFKQY